MRLLLTPNLREIGIKGQVIYETRNTLVIRTKKGDSIIPKEKRVFLFRLPNNREVTVIGDRLIGRPEERVKRA